MAVEDLSPDEFRERVRDGLHRTTPEEFQLLRRLYERDGPGALKETARANISEDLEDPEPYIDALVEAFRLELDRDQDQ